MKKLLILLIAFIFVSSLCSRIAATHRRHKGALAVISISGPIQSSMPSAWAATDADDIARKLHKLSEDPDVKAIVLRINSPGGTVGSVQEIDKEIARCRAKGKKIVASLNWTSRPPEVIIGANTDRIVSNPGTITGSIGVILEFGDLQGLFQKVGLKLEVIKSGAHKDIGSPARALTAEESPDAASVD